MGLKDLLGRKAAKFPKVSVGFKLVGKNPMKGRREAPKKRT